MSPCRGPPGPHKTRSTTCAKSYHRDAPAIDARHPDPPRKIRTRRGPIPLLTKRFHSFPQVRSTCDRVPPADEEPPGVVLAEEAGLLLKPEVGCLERSLRSRQPELSIPNLRAASFFLSLPQQRRRCGRPSTRSSHRLALSHVHLGNLSGLHCLERSEPSSTEAADFPTHMALASSGT
jgi:hypothetical protein